MSERVRLREANPSDSSELNEFFSSIPLQGSLDIKIRRQIDFFSLYHRLGNKFKTFILESVGRVPHEYLGTASFLLKNFNLNDKPEEIAIGCDLRISSQRKAVLNWSKYFLSEISQLKTKEHVRHIITSINLTESQVINAFIRPKVRRTSRPIYELIQKYDLVTLHGFYPTRFSTNDAISVKSYSQSDKAELIQYIEKNLKHFDLVPASLIENIETYIHDSLLHAWSQFLIARDHEGRIVGCVHPLNSSLLQDYFPQRYNSQANNFRQFLKFASLLHFGRKLTKPYSSSMKDETLNFKMLHFLFFDHPEVFKSLIYKAYKSAARNEFLVYAYQKENISMRPPKGTINTEMPFALYEIKTPDEDTTSLKSYIKKNIWLDGLWF